MFRIDSTPVDDDDQNDSSCSGGLGDYVCFKVEKSNLKYFGDTRHFCVISQEYYDEVKKEQADI